MLIRSSLPRVNPVTLPDAICIVSSPELKTEKSLKSHDFTGYGFSSSRARDHGNHQVEKSVREFVQTFAHA